MDQPTPLDDVSVPDESEEPEQKAADTTDAPSDTYYSDRLARSWGAALSMPPPPPS